MDCEGERLVTNLPLDDRQVDVWYVLSSEITDPHLFDEYRAMLPREEVEQEQRFVFEKSRIEFLIARVLVRTVLSHYTGHDLGAWRFERNAYGKPAVAAPAGVSLQFNLSHTRGLVACAVTGQRAVGIDAEHLSRTADHLTLARRFFAAAEAAVIENARSEDQADWFLRFWTLKEAFIKAKGQGLSIPLGDFAFALSNDRPPRASFGGSVDERPDDWQFAQLRLGNEYQVALAVDLPVTRPLAVRIAKTTPLRWHDDGRVLPANPSNEWSL